VVPVRPSGRDWEPPKIPLAAPAFCISNKFTDSSCFGCRLSDCFFNMLPERTHGKNKPTKDVLRKSGKLAPLKRRRYSANGNGHRPEEEAVLNQDGTGGSTMAVEATLPA